MPQVSSDQVVELIKLIGPAQTLREDLEKMIHLETYEGMGATALQTTSGLLGAVCAIAPDGYISSISTEPGPDADDRVKVSQAHLTAGQIVAYLTSATGVGSSASGDTAISVQRNCLIGSNIKGQPGLVERVLADGPPPPPPPPPGPPPPAPAPPPAPPAP